MKEKERKFCPYTTFVPRVERFKAVQYDGNIRCLDIFPIQDMKFFKVQNGTIISHKFKLIINVGDFIIFKDHEYSVADAECFNRRYAPAPECIAENLVGALSSTRKLESWMVIPND